jgi:hypothetical protein
MAAKRVGATVCRPEGGRPVPRGTDAPYRPMTTHSPASCARTVTVSLGAQGPQPSPGPPLQALPANSGPNVNVVNVVNVVNHLLVVNV